MTPAPTTVGSRAGTASLPLNARERDELVMLIDNRLELMTVVDREDIWVRDTLTRLRRRLHELQPELART